MQITEGGEGQRLRRRHRLLCATPVRIGDEERRDDDRAKTHGNAAGVGSDGRIRWECGMFLHAENESGRGWNGHERRVVTVG